MKKCLLTLLLALSITLGFSQSFSRTHISEAITHINVYPNPSHSGDFWVKLELLPTEKSTHVRVYNLLGKLILADKVSSNEVHYNKSFSLSNMPKGVYMLEVTQGDQRMTRRLSFI
ncbi:MAG: T9SS type A sorting domain-containing protein [Bacteroidota bacterium]